MDSHGLDQAVSVNAVLFISSSFSSDSDKFFIVTERLNVVMDSEFCKESSSNYPQYETPLGYKIEDVRPHGGIDIFRSAAYSNCVRKPS
ncbi:hypothetical protein SUGI_0198550 [Cryptomeria japonica]|nr:hypothetical protein SUGI_0198550 [Cryptomeria japonica]